jgi:hypothetical protein
MKLLLLVNSLLIAAPLLAGQRSALVAQSIIRWPFVVDHHVQLFRPLRTLLAEMPRLTTSMCSVFHGSTAFPEFAYEKSLVCSQFAVSLSQGVQVKKFPIRGAAKVLNVFANAKLLNVIWQNPTELIFGIRGTI